MGDMLYPWLYYPVSVEDVYGLGIAGISIKQYEEVSAEAPVEVPVEYVQEETLQRENEEYSSENVGKNIDVYA